MTTTCLMQLLLHPVAAAACVAAGVPIAEQPGASERLRRKTTIPSHLELSDLEDFLVSLYPRIPQLARVGFTLCKATKLRHLLPVTGTSVTELRVEMNRSQLFIRPKRDLMPLVCTGCQ